MALTNFQFPGVTLKQNFEDTGVTTTGNLSVACIGKHCSSHRHDVASEAEKLSSYYDSTNGITGDTLSKYGQGTIAESNRVLYVMNGLFKYASTTATGASSASAITFAVNATASQEIVFSEDLKGGTHVEALFGTRGVCAGDKIYIVTGTTKTVATILGFKNSSSGYTTLLINKSIATTATTTIDFCIEYSGSELAVSSGTLLTITVTGETTKTATAKVAGGVFTVVTGAGAAANNGKCTLVSGDAAGNSEQALYVEYLESSTKYVGKIGVASSADDVTSMLGKPCNDNPLALAVYFAVMTSAGTDVYFTAVADDTAYAYTTALSLLDKYSDIYSIVPAISGSTSEEVAKAIVTQVNAYNENLSSDVEGKCRRTTWYGIECTAVTGSDPAIVIDNVNGKRWTNSYRAQCVWADGAIFNGETVKNFAVAAAAAGMRSGQYVHRPLSNLTYSLFSVAETWGLTRSHYKQIASNGIWVVANNGNGVPINMRQLTTAISNTNINLNEESCVANADSIALDLCRLGENYVGNSNISSSLLIKLSELISKVMNSKLIDHTNTSYIGPQLLSWSLDSIKQNDTNLDHVDATITCTPPKPFNRFNMTLTIL